MQRKRRRFIKRRWTGYIQKRKCSRIGQYRKELSVITYGVETIIECNKKIVVDYLNVTFNLMQTMPQTGQQDHIYKCTIKLSTKHNKTTSKNKGTTTVQQLL